MGAMKGANLALRFVLEVVAVVAFGYWGFKVGSGSLMKFVLGLGIPILCIVVWAVFVSPKAAVTMPQGAKVILGLVILELAAAALFVAGQPVIAVAFGVVALGNQILMRVWKQ